MSQCVVFKNVVGRLGFITITASSVVIVASDF